MPSVANFLIERMENAGIKHIFGVPGDYILSMFKKLSDHKAIDIVNTTTEANAGFAADAYARVAGIGCVCVTYNVGSFNVTNACAGAFAEHSPMVILCGSPGIKERQEGLRLHHTVGSFECQREVFQNITCDSCVLGDPSTAGLEIDRVFESMAHHKQPIYIELPRDVADKPLEYDVYKQLTPKSPTSDPENLAEALEEVVGWIRSSKNPVIMAGVQLARFGLAEQVIKFAERHNIPMVTEMLSKSTIGENHPLFAGVYAGPSSRNEVSSLVEESDCLLMFGAVISDMTTGFVPAKFSNRQTVSVTVDSLTVKNHSYQKVVFGQFCTQLFKQDLGFKLDNKVKRKSPLPKFVANDESRLTSTRFFELIDTVLTKDHAIIADVGNSLFGSMDLTVGQSNHFISPAYYLSMGMAIPGALGLQLASPSTRPLVLVGDGAFQMSFSEMSTILSRKLNPIIFVLNNRGYTTERFLLDGPFNDIRDWNYHATAAVFGGGDGEKVENEGQLQSAVMRALASKNLYVINIILDQKDTTPALERMVANGLSKRVTSQANFAKER